ncbi:MAG TPA: RDD family protein [Candidatus Acidoferrales bacterium]|nr:RDD family protein [Candidatus Acidoferrales bacterium]
MFCSKCGAQVADSAAFCPACGQATRAEAPVPRGIPLAPGGFTPAAASYPPPPPSPGTVPTAYPRTAPMRAVAYAGFWLRFVAWIIDFVVLWIVSTFTSMIFMTSSGMRGMILNNPPQTPEQLFAMLGSFSKLIFVNCVIQWLYYALLESSTWQGTLGKKALGLEVTDMAGRRVSFARATGRYFGKIISSIILLIGFIMAGFTAQKQALHDMMASCLVIRKI